MSTQSLSSWRSADGKSAMSEDTLGLLREHDRQEVRRLFRDERLLPTVRAMFAASKEAAGHFYSGGAHNTDSFIVAGVAASSALDAGVHGLAEWVQTRHWNFLLLGGGTYTTELSLVFSVDEYIALGTISEVKKDSGTQIRMVVDEVINVGDIGSMEFQAGKRSWSVDAFYPVANERAQAKRDKGPDYVGAVLTSGLLGGATGALVGAAYVADRANREKSAIRHMTGTENWSGDSDTLTCAFHSFWDAGLESRLTVRAISSDAETTINGADDVPALIERALTITPEARVLRVEQLAYIEAHGNLEGYVAGSDDFLDSIKDDPDGYAAACSAKSRLARRADDYTLGQAAKAEKNTAKRRSINPGACLVVVILGAGGIFLAILVVGLMLGVLSTLR